MAVLKMLDLSGVSLLNILPPNIAGDKAVQMAAQAFDKELREIVGKIPGVSVYPRIAELTDNLLLDLLAWQFHVDFYDTSMEIKTKRILVEKSLDWHFRKGTPAVVEEIVQAIIGNAVVTEWFEYGGEPGYFRVETEEPIEDDKTFEDLVAAIYSVKNTRSWLEFVLILVKGTLDLFVGMGVVLDDIVFIGLPGVDIEIDVADPVIPYIGVFPSIVHEIRIAASKQ